MRKVLHQLAKDDIQANEAGDRWLDLVRNHVVDLRQVKVNINPASMLPGSTQVMSITVTGIKVGDDILQICKPSLANGVFVAHGIVSADNTASILFVNANNGTIDEPEEEYTITYIKNSRQ